MQVLIINIFLRLKYKNNKFLVLLKEIQGNQLRKNEKFLRRTKSLENLKKQKLLKVFFFSYYYHYALYNK